MTDAVVVTRNSRAALGFAFIAGVAIGVIAGAHVVKKAIMEDMEARIDEEIETFRASYGAVHKKPWATPQEAVAELHPEAVIQVNKFEQPEPRTPVAYDKIREFKEGDVAPDEDIDPEEEHALEAEFGSEAVQNNIFEGQRILLIPEEVFAEDEGDFVKETVNWYPLDEVLTDVRDNKIESYAKTVGTEFVSKFGVGEDPNTLFVRNERLKVDYEICNQPNGSYEQLVLGIGEEPQISDRDRINGA